MRAKTRVILEMAIEQGKFHNRSVDGGVTPLECTPRKFSVPVFLDFLGLLPSEEVSGTV